MHLARFVTADGIHHGGWRHSAANRRHPWRRLSPHAARKGRLATEQVGPLGADRFFADVVPILQRRGLVCSAYVGPTLRDHLGLAVPSPAR
ncbi:MULTISPECIES: hypothetical protein [unclassified Sphingomonas]|uniref:hypothetical protein n=1 Tax=Novosphingobium rhizosphaerae TaxID=1551649 RepID=UPI0017FA7A71